MRKLSWGLIGGGEGSQIGPAHRIGAALDGLYAFAAGALDVDPERGRAFAIKLGIAPERAYGDWQDDAGRRTRPIRTASISSRSRLRTRRITRSPKPSSKRESPCCAKSR